MTENKRPWSPPQIIWSGIISIVVWSAVGFSWFGYGFDWQTNGAAEKSTSNAIMDTMATICAAQARNAPDAEVELKKLAELSSWKRREFIETAHWATMPGSDSALRGVADLCATKLSEI
ncbi:MAG: hypothetical protein ACR2RL_20495 [Gammaproteobacteria bacterium]